MKRTRSRTSAKRAAPRKPVRRTQPIATRQAVQLKTISVPRVGALWPGQGGRFAGIGMGADGAPDHLLIAHFAGEKGTHAQALDYPKSLAVDGHKDFESPTLADGALCYASLKPFVKGWYWLREQAAGVPAYAWTQSFGTGYQLWNRKSDSYGVFAVRRIPIH